MDFVKKILFEQKRVRLVGVCFGHQIIGRALGQKVGRSEGGWEISVTPMRLTEKGREVGEEVERNVDCPVCEGEGEGVSALAACVPSSHHPHSVIVCRISGEITHEPMAFPNG